MKINTLLILLAAVTFMSTAQPVRQTDHTGIVESAELVKPLLPGMTLADTCLQDMAKQSVCTDELLQDKPTVLIVYRGGWCPYCNAQLNRMKDIESDLTKLGYQLIAVSPDSNRNIQKQQSTQSIKFTLLTDDKLALSKSLGLAYFLDKKTEAMYRDKLGVPFIDVKGDKRVALPVPAVYIIDKTGVVHFQYVNPNFRLRLNEQVLLTAAQQAIKVMD